MAEAERERGLPPTVLVAGTFDPDFSRNRVMLDLLERSGFRVRTLRQPLWGADRVSLVDQSKLRLTLRAIRAYARLIWGLARTERPDVILVLYPGHTDVPLVAAVARRRRIPVLFDIFISLNDTIVGDRAMRSPGSLMDRGTRLVDSLACRLADRVIADTPPHADFLAERAHIDRSRIGVLWLGAQERVFQPVDDVEPEPNLVVFHGTFIRLQGIETIIRAAKILEPVGVRFRLVGDGQERLYIEALVAELEVGNVELPGRVPLADVPREIARGALCLGIFGTSSKASRVVPNKVFECLAVGRPVVTADTSAIRAAFDGEVALVPPGDPEALANRIEHLLADPAELDRLASAGRSRFRADYSEAALSALLAKEIRRLVRS